MADARLLVTLNEIIIDLAIGITSNRTSLDEALQSVETWVERNACTMTDVDREDLVQMLGSDRVALAPEDGRNNATRLVTSTLRVHAQRMLERSDEAASENGHAERAGERFQRVLRATAAAVREARADVAIAETHRSLARPHAGERWLRDALGRLERIQAQDPATLARRIPASELPRLGVLREALFRVRGLDEQEIFRRRARALSAKAAVQRRELVDLARLLAASLAALGDKPAARKALALLGALR